MRGSVEGLGDVEGQDMVFRHPLLKPALRKENGRRRCRARHCPKLPIRLHPLQSQDNHKSTQEGGREHPHVLLPQCNGPIHVQAPVADSLGIGHIMALCWYSGTSAPRRMAPYACTSTPCWILVPCHQ